MDFNFYCSYLPLSLSITLARQSPFLRRSAEINNKRQVIQDFLQQTEMDERKEFVGHPLKDLSRNTTSR